MNIPDRDALRQYLTEHAVNSDLVAPAMQLLEPLFQDAEAVSDCLLSAQVKPNREEVTKALSALAGKPVKVAFFSWGTPFPKPEWMSERAYRERDNEALWEGLETSCAGSFKALLQDLLAAPEEVGVPMSEAFAEHLLNALMENLQLRLEIDSEHRSDDEPQELLYATLWYTLFYFGSAVIMGDGATMEQMAPLMRLLPQAIPLAEKADKPGTWIVLTA